MQRTKLWKQIIVLLVGAALQTALLACGAVPAGQAADVSDTIPATSPPPAETPTVGPGTTSAPTVISHGGPVQDQVSLIDALRAAGATVTVGGQIEQPFLQVTGTQITVNGADVQLFEYADPAAAQADAAALADVLAGKGTVMITWVASPHAYRAGRVIALYVGDDAATLQLLQATLGAPFAELNIPSR